MAGKKYWTCPCGTRNEWIKQKCPTCRRSRPKRRVPIHERTLRDDSYAVYREINEKIHGHAFDGDWQPDDCGVCGKPPKVVRLDREHGHDRSEPTYGKPRGLACPGDWGCNALMARLTLRKAREIVAYLERCEAFYGAETC